MKANTVIQNGTVQTLCRMCDTRCAVNIHIQDGVMVDITPYDGHPVNQGQMCVRGPAAIDLFYHPDRILKPLKRMSDGTFSEISYDQAMDEIAEKIFHIKETYGARAVGAWKGEAVDTAGEIFTTWNKTWTRNGRVVWGYDYTDPDFLSHMTEVYKHLRQGGIRGLMFDYPSSGWASAGGMEDDYSTTAAAYRTIFRLPYEGLDPGSYVHERNMIRGSDISIGLVASMRTENDTDEMDGSTVTRCGLRWYKNRVLLNQDTDSKNIVRLQGNRDLVRAVLTMAYVTTGRLLLANSFSQFSPETLWDLTRTFPYHTAPRSARPVDAFVSDFPAVYDFEVDPQWHQVTFYNPDPDSSRIVGIDIAGKPVQGALGLDAQKSYYAFDFWNKHFIGKLRGDARLEQELRPGEARMMSVRECQEHPQVLSTDRHVMQGYLDLVGVDWDEVQGILKGVSRMVGGDPYTITLALNGFDPLAASCGDQETLATLAPSKDGLVRLTLERPENATVEWSVSFQPPHE